MKLGEPPLRVCGLLEFCITETVTHQLGGRFIINVIKFANSTAFFLRSTSLSNLKRLQFILLVWK
jgi:hypothetical protein